ncbi:helix-turn-helix domain-containing protein [Paenibacillus plantiphilus]|uniref:helix-turn-helix domain-containing protein n=1 Tax=Paenibacillus plantiphilus TaxID=2905650 RepID=UPI001F43EAFD|nr:helix-turn-helix transcriptional regulator [Paenibacillus plantiphilus]
MSDAILKLVGGKVRELRKERGLSQEELGERAGFHFSYVGGLERGERNVSLENLAKVAETLGVDIGELFGYVRDYDKPLTEKEKALQEAFFLLLNRDEKEIQMAINVLTEVFKTYAPK